MEFVFIQIFMSFKFTHKWKLVSDVTEKRNEESWQFGIRLPVSYWLIRYLAMSLIAFLTIHSKLIVL